MLNQVFLIGRVGADPEVRQVNGQNVAKFRLATSEKWTDKEGNKNERTEWHTIEVWGRKADVIGQYVSKGSLISIQGKISYSTKEDDQGGKITYTQIRCDNFQLLGGKN